MKLARIITLAPILACLWLAACVTARIEESRNATTAINPEHEALVILGRASYSDREADESFIGCLAGALASGKRPLRLVAESKFKDDLYPWFEPRTAPVTSDDLSRLFAQSGVRERIEASGVRFLAWIDGDTVTINKGGGFSCTISTVGGGCLGLSYWEEDASYEAAIWDLETLTTAGRISADATGTSYMAGLIIPIPVLARPGNAACKALGAQMKDFLQAGS